MDLKTFTIDELLNTHFDNNAVKAGIVSSTTDAQIFKLKSSGREVVELKNGDFIVLSARARHIDVDTSQYDQNKVELPLATVVKTSFSDNGSLTTEAKRKAADFLGMVDKQMFNLLREKRLVLMLKHGGFLLAPKTSLIFNLSGTKYKLHGDTKPRAPYKVQPTEERYDGFLKTHNVKSLSDFITEYFAGDKGEFSSRVGKPTHSINALLKNERKVVETAEEGVWCLLSKITIFVDLDTSALDTGVTLVSYEELVSITFGDEVPTTKAISERLGVGVTSVVNWSVSNMHFIRLKDGGWLTAPDKLVKFNINH